MKRPALGLSGWEWLAHRLIGIGLPGVGLAAILFVVSSSWQCPHTSAFPLKCPTPLQILSPNLTALGFMISAFVAWYMQRPNSVVVYFWLGGMALTTGFFSGAGPLIADLLFLVTLIWLAPFSLKAYMTLLGRSPKPAERAFLTASVVLAVIWTAPFFAYSGFGLPVRDMARNLRDGVLFSLLFALVLIPIVLWRGYRSGLGPAAARQVRFVALGSSLAFAPLTLLTILPILAGSRVQTPYEAVFPWLLLSPLSFLYASYRSRLARFEPLLDRIFVIFLLTVVSLSAYLIAQPLVLRLKAPAHLEWLVIGAALLVSILLFRRLEWALDVFTSWPFEGDQPPRTVIDRLTEAFSLTTDRAVLRQLLLERLPQTVRARAEVLALRVPGQELTLQYAALWTPTERAQWRMSVTGVLANHLVEWARPMASSESGDLLAYAGLAPAEARLLDMPPGALLLPLVSGGALQGILVMAGRPDDDPWRHEDCDMLTIFGRQAGATIHNLLLLEQVRAARDELEHVHQQFVVSQERQQHQLAQELHDRAVQRLLGISYQLASVQHYTDRSADSLTPAVAEIRAEVLEVSRQLRALIGQLRPAGLDEMGLVVALEGYVAQVQRGAAPCTPVIRLNLDRRGAFLSDALSICLFRAAQEGIRNALEHAHASQIDVDLRVVDDRVLLTVRDDGCGFTVPERLSELAQMNHFGLIAVAERVAWIGGQFSVQSQAAQGATMRISLPLR